MQYRWKVCAVGYSFEADAEAYYSFYTYCDWMFTMNELFLWINYFSSRDRDSTEITIIIATIEAPVNYFSMYFANLTWVVFATDFDFSFRVASIIAQHQHAWWEMKPGARAYNVLAIPRISIRWRLRHSSVIVRIQLRVISAYSIGPGLCPHPTNAFHPPPQRQNSTYTVLVQTALR